MSSNHADLRHALEANARLREKRLGDRAKIAAAKALQRRAHDGLQEARRALSKVNDAVSRGRRILDSKRLDGEARRRGAQKRAEIEAEYMRRNPGASYPFDKYLTKKAGS